MSKSGYYAWVNREPSKRTLNDSRLLIKIKAIYKRVKGRYGSPRIYQTLKYEGIFVGRKRVARLMKLAGLKGRVTRVSTKQRGFKLRHVKHENHLLLHGNATSLNEVWVADVTYLKVKGKWQYLATIMDQCSRRILGWALAGYRTTKLTSRALTYALKKRGYPKDVLFHTDRGVEFMGAEFQKILNRHNFKHSMNRAGYCTDNAFMESFYHSLKGELVRGTVFTTTAELHDSLRRYINQFYNAIRLHSGIGYQSPMKYEAQYGV